MKLFHLPDGHILQLADEAKIQSWNAEMPLIFIGNIKEKRIPAYRKEYPKAVVKEIEDYLDKILKNVAIPKLINAIQDGAAEEKLAVAENIQQLSESKNVDQLKIAIPHIKTAMQDKNKEVAKLMATALKNYEKAQKKKQTAKKRKILTGLRKQMDSVDIEFAEGKISDSEYITKQKEYLKLKREIELEEKV